MTRAKWWVGLVSSIVFVSTPSRVAHASSDPYCTYCNYGLPSEVSIASSEIGIDSVIVVRLVDAAGRVPDVTWWELVTVAVTDLDDEIVDGTLEINPGFSPAAWRPSDPWVPGTYRVAVHVDLPAFNEPEFEACRAFVRVGEVVVVDEARHVLGEQSLSVTEIYAMVPQWTLSTIVCCDGALPRFRSLPGLGCPGAESRLTPGAGDCAEYVGHGSLELDAELLLEGEILPSDYTLREVTHEETSASGGGLMRVVISQPECLEFEVLDLVTGERRSHGSCHGDEVADKLGILELDPSEGLAECEGEPYVCDVIGEGWNRFACASWPEGAPIEHPSTLPSDADEPEPSEEAADSCACDVENDRSGRGEWLALLALSRWSARCRRGLGLA